MFLCLAISRNRTHGECSNNLMRNFSTSLISFLVTYFYLIKCSF
jgi:hypothetical protein